VKDSELIAKMKKFSPQTNWVLPTTRYTVSRAIEGIPELAVLALKRFWSGQINEEQIWRTVKNTNQSKCF